MSSRATGPERGGDREERHGRVPSVAVVGRQNVGKSTLVNRLVGRRAAIAHESPGVTRDRVQVAASWRGRRFDLVDTGGFVHRARGIDGLVSEQAERATSDADLVLLVVDNRAGITDADAMLARRLRRSSTPVLVVANKVDAEPEEADVAGLYRLGLGEPASVSALSGRGAGDLLDRIVQLLPRAGPGEVHEAHEPRFALVGGPNVGKSSLFNALVGEGRSVVFEEAGTTRDSVDAVVRWPGGPVRFVDTAGMRRPTKVQGIEYYAFLRAASAIDRTDVAVLVIDAARGFADADKKIAVRVIDSGRGLLVVANKWDLVEEKERTFARLRGDVALFADAMVVRTSAVRGQGVHRLAPLLLDLHARWMHRVPTSTVNEVVQQAQAERSAPRAVGTFRYATQVSSGPPVFVLFGGARAPTPGYQRYLENRLRHTFGFEGVPIRLTFRVRTRARGPR